MLYSFKINNFKIQDENSGSIGTLILLQLETNCQIDFAYNYWPHKTIIFSLSNLIALFLLRSGILELKSVGLLRIQIWIDFLFNKKFRFFLPAFYLIVWLMTSPKNSHIENMTAVFLLRCKSLLQYFTPEIMHFQAWKNYFNHQKCHSFWSNKDLDTLSTSKWSSESQFCERYLCSFFPKKDHKWAF